MRKYIIMALLTALLVGLASCSPKVTTRVMHGTDSVRTVNKSYNELTMDLDKTPITYTIDISTEAGRMKLNGLSVEEADDLALTEAIMANQCVTIFEPKYTHLVKGGKVLRVTIYGHPARYKNK